MTTTEDITTADVVQTSTNSVEVSTLYTTSEELTSATRPTSGIQTSNTPTTDPDLLSSAYVTTELSAMRHTTESARSSTVTLHNTSLGLLTETETESGNLGTELTSGWVFPTTSHELYTETEANAGEVRTGSLSELSTAAERVTTSVMELTQGGSTQRLGGEQQPTTASHAEHDDLCRQFCTADGSDDGPTPSNYSDSTTVKPSTASVVDDEREDYLFAERLMEEVAAIPEEIQHQLGIQAEELILDCQFAGVSCSHV